MTVEARIADIPVVDISASFGTDESAIQAAADALGRAFETHGFLTLTGHGIASETVRDMRIICRSFFDLNQDAKMSVLSQPKQGKFCGYVPFAVDSAAVTYQLDEAPPDLRERYRAVVSGSEDVRAKVGVNQWPELDDFEAQWRAWYAAMEDLAGRLIGLCARALELAPNALEPYFDEHFSVLVAAFSPPVNVSDQGQMRCGEHCDFGTLTIVHQETGEGGLEIYSGGRWLKIPARGDAFVVNIGDLMARWTNDRWVSTRHRVALPKKDEAGRGRLSLIYFNQPNLFTEIRCLPTCESPQRPAKYPPTTLQEHFSAKQAKLQAHQASKAGQ